MIPNAHETTITSSRIPPMALYMIMLGSSFALSSVTTGTATGEKQQEHVSVLVCLVVFTPAVKGPHTWRMIIFIQNQYNKRTQMPKVFPAKNDYFFLYGIKCTSTEILHLEKSLSRDFQPSDVIGWGTRWRRPANPMNRIPLNRNREKKNIYDRLCVVDGCFNCQRLGLTLHLSQREDSTRRKWVYFVKIGRADFNGTSVLVDLWCTFFEWLNESYSASQELMTSFVKKSTLSSVDQ